MSGTSNGARRIVTLVTVLGVIAAVTAWVRRRSGAPTPTAPAEWPPIHPEPDVGATAAAAAPAVGWVAAGETEGPPIGFPVKVKVSSGIFHVPGGRFYDRTNADRFYATEDAAEADGYRRSKS